MTAKYATLQRVAQSDPDGVAQSISVLKQKLQEQVENLETMEENLGLTVPADVIEGDAAVADPVDGAPVTIEAGLQRVAAEAPEQIEEAINEFYQGMDEVLALTENLADNLGLELTPPEAEDFDDGMEGENGEMEAGEPTPTEGEEEEEEFTE